jgi:putative transposase
MPRRLRVHLPGGFYHVTLRGNHQQAIFFSDRDRTLLNGIVAEAIEKFSARVHAYCWMGNHIHLLLQAGTEPISRTMHYIATTYARIKQRHMQTTGHFFERRYHALLVDADSYLLQLLRYIHLNPVTAGIARELTDYQWSSHHNYAGTRNDPWVTTEFVWSVLAVDRTVAISAYRSFIDDRTADDWVPDDEMSADRQVLGGDGFAARLACTPLAGRVRQSLEELITEACRRFEVEREMLNSPARDPYRVKVRAWIAHQAECRGIATRSAVARALGRTEGALRHAIRAYPDELE